jgi:hypothetical protein
MFPKLIIMIYILMIFKISKKTSNLYYNHQHQKQKRILHLMILIQVKEVMLRNVHKVKNKFLSHLITF